MLQNKIYQNYFKEIFKSFLVILFGLSIIAWTVRAVNFLDLIVDNGYSVITYFQYSFLNLFGILTKFIPLSFLLSLIIFIIRQTDENEFVILWTSGVQKLKLVNLFLVASLIIILFYTIFSAFITPFALNKSRVLLSKDGFNSFLPTIRVQQFSDSFQGFTFLVEKKFKNKIKKVFIHDTSNTIKNLSSLPSEDKSYTTIVAEEGIVEEKQMILFNGYVLSSGKDASKNDLIKFQQFNLDLDKLKSDTIKIPKLQETSTIKLFKCLLNQNDIEILNCKKNEKRETIATLNRRIFLPFYIPLVAILCSFLLIKTHYKKNYFLNKFSIFFFSFLVLLYSELIIRYTGISKNISILFIATPFLITPVIYFLLFFKLSRETQTK